MYISFHCARKCLQSTLSTLRILNLWEVEIFCCKLVSSGQGKSMYMFSAERLLLSPPPACWLYPLKPGGEQKAEDVWRKMYTLIYPDPVSSGLDKHTRLNKHTSYYGVHALRIRNVYKVEVLGLLSLRLKQDKKEQKIIN